MTEAAHPGGRLRGAAGRLRVSPDAAYALRYATAVSAAIWLGHLPGLVTNESQWILITVLMVMQPMAGGSLVKGLLRAFGTAAGAATAILLFGLYAQEPAQLLAALFLVQALAAYGFTGARYQYAWFVWAFTSAIVLGGAMAGTGDVETLAFQRASMVGLGLLVVFAVDSLLWPRHAEPSLRASLAGRARKLAAALQRAIETPVAASAHPADGASPASPLAGQLGLIDAVRSEIGALPSRVTTLTHVALLLEGLASRERILRRPLGLEPGSVPAPVLAALSQLGRAVASALEEVAAALAADRAVVAFATDLERALLTLESERGSSTERAAARAHLEGRSAALRDLVVLLRTLEQECGGGAAETSREPGSAATTPARAARLRPDPFRVQIALRSGIAVCAAFLLPMALGWEINTMVAPLAFMVACTTTRGGVTQSLALLTGAVAIGWLLADLALVFFTPHIGRVPAGLLYPAAVAGVFAFLAAKRPQLAVLPTVGGLIALLPVFSGPAAPTDVEGTYDLVCYVAVALGTGWVSGRSFWPATAARLFRERIAVQLELCLGALHPAPSDAEPTGRRRGRAELLAAYARQRAQLVPLDAQARHEPVERCLDDALRGKLLARSQDLFDTVYAAPPETGVPTGRGEASLARLHAALARTDDALRASLQAAAHALRAGSPAIPSPDLARARSDAEARLAELRERPPPDLDPRDRDAILVQIDWQRQLVTRQLALEAWLRDWARAAGRRSSPA